MIIGEIRRFLRDDSPVKVSRSLKENAYKIQQMRDVLTATIHREPTVSEIAAELGLTREEVVTAIDAAQTPTSIYETIHQDKGDPVYLLDNLKDKEGGDTLWLDKLSMQELLEKLPEREKQIIIWRFFEDKTQSEVAQKVNISQVQVSRLERQALKKLRDLY
jgi:RNA polymerase sporulation-specific sigma factor